MSHAGKGVGPDWCLSLVPRCGLHATHYSYSFGFSVANQSPVLELEKVRAPARSPPWGRDMLQNMTSQHAEGICVKSQEVVPVHTRKGGSAFE